MEAAELHVFWPFGTDQFLQFVPNRGRLKFSTLSHAGYESSLIFCKLQWFGDSIPNEFRGTFLQERERESEVKEKEKKKKLAFFRKSYRL